MAKGKQPSKAFTSLFQGISRFFRKGRQAVARWLQGWVIKLKRRSKTTQAGFVLPTVTMVLLVVVLLTLTISFRAFERSQDARFARVSEAALNAATPALGRAEAKLEFALQDLSDRGETLSDDNLYALLTSLELTEDEDEDDYFFRFGDEEVLKVNYDIDDNGSIQPNGAAPDRDGRLDDDEVLEDNESTTIAWRFPVDTDNDGVNDSYTLYGIFFRRPLSGKRTPLDARTLPMPPLGSATRPECAFANGTNESLVTPSGWIPTQGKLKKSFFVYTVTVPINGNSKGGISALEYQQDWRQEFLNGVVYEGDLEITPGPAFRLTGSLFTQGNLIVSPFRNELTLYQTSSYRSCFADEGISKIKVAGNVINGMVANGNQRNNVGVHLFNPNLGQGDQPAISNGDGTQSIDLNAFEGSMFNDLAYRERLEGLVNEQIDNGGGDPTEVEDAISRQVANDPTLVEEEVRREELRSYFASRLRKVPFAEVGLGEDGTVGLALNGGGDTLAPPEAWSIEQPEDFDIIAAQLVATDPELREPGQELQLGDRVLVGNNQPALELDEEGERWVPAVLEPDEANTGNWTTLNGEEGEERDRVTRAEKLPDAGDRSRSGFWERNAAIEPETPFDGIGGLRVITGAGIYTIDPANESFLPRPQWIDPAGTVSATYNDPSTDAVNEAYTIVWPDTMPMSSPGLTEKGDLQMRATAVYHYAENAINPPEQPYQDPIACVSSYYDPSTAETAQNEADGGRSNNGIDYGAPRTSSKDTNATLAGNGWQIASSTPDYLAAQANMVFPDGRFANQPLRNALLKLAKGEDPLNLEDQAAIDTTICAQEILDGTITAGGVIPDGAIREATLLDARQVKANEADDPATAADETFTLSNPALADAPDFGNQTNADETYDLPIGERQPLEVRVTQIDLDVLRNEDYNNDYLLPYSGIIYASRDDALPDRSYLKDDAGNPVNEATIEELSPVDYILDPSRRPNGIMLLNGASLGRNDNQAATSLEDILQEKGLTLVSNLPVYIQAEDSDVGVGFNIHTQYEFGQGPNGRIDFTNIDFNDFYNRENLNPNFACRAGDTYTRPANFECGEGDNWRPATVLADAITLLSDSFRLGYRNEGDFDLRNNAGGGNVVIENGYPLGGPSDEGDYGIDLDGSGVAGDNNSVPDAEITVKAARQLNGFNAYNNFATNGLSSGADFDNNDDGTLNFTSADTNYVNNAGDRLDSTYFNNFVTPVQRRVEFPEYVMEICRKLPVSSCLPEDWVIGIDANGNGTFDTGENETADAIIVNGTGINTAGELLSGTTARPPLDQNDQRYPRRVAFLRYSTPAAQQYKLVLNGNTPIPLGIDNSGNVNYYPYSNVDLGLTNGAFSGTVGGSGATNFPAGVPEAQPNALWYVTADAANPTNDPIYNDADYLFYQTALAGAGNVGTVQQPLLIPVLQIYAPDKNPQNDFPGSINTDDLTRDTRWVPPAGNDADFNLVLGAADVPGRPGETNGGLQNLARFLENWQEPERTTNILGSFIQSGRSEYATAPYVSIRGNADVFTGIDNQRTTYKLSNANGQIGSFLPPARNWGFDVGLLYQQAPDFFTQSFATLEKGTSGAPLKDEYFREVSRDDGWVKGLLCAEVITENDDNIEGDNAVPKAIRPNCDEYGG
jgi:hypothetical protein